MKASRIIVAGDVLTNI